MAFEIVYSEELVPHRLHTHVYYELLYITKGSVLFTHPWAGFSGRGRSPCVSESI